MLGLKTMFASLNIKIVDKKNKENICQLEVKEQATDTHKGHSGLEEKKKL